MKQKFTKHLSFFLLLPVLLACTPSTTSTSTTSTTSTTSSITDTLGTEPLSNTERILVGNWWKKVNNGQIKGFYMEFHEGRTGIFGPVIDVNNKLGIFYYTTFLMKDWKIKNDTLSFKFERQPGLVAYGSDGKEIKESNKPSYNYYIVWELSDTVIVLQNLIGEYPIKDRFRKSEKLGIIEQN
jgi:hypothetical protein